MSDVVLSCSGLTRHFREGGVKVEVLNDIDLRIVPGECLAVTGKSGCGKSTLLHLLGGLDRPTAGSVEIDGAPFSTLGPRARARIRNRRLGFIYQFHHLLPEFDAVENVALPLLLREMPIAEARGRAIEALNAVGLDARLHHRPAKLSGGERQRVAVARALSGRPGLVLADEPTGNLDRRNAEEVISLMLNLNRDYGSALIIVTHDEQLAARADRVLTIADGRVVAA